MEPTIEVMGTTGIMVTFPDGAIITLTIQGRFPCSTCGHCTCEHFHAALPHWNRFRWKMAEREDSPWGPRLLQSIGIIPPFIVRPDYLIKQTRWSPFGYGEEIAPGVLAWHTARGRLYRFDVNEGHVYIGSDHPDGYTPCLICQQGECNHLARALKLEAQVTKN